MFADIDFFFLILFSKTIMFQLNSTTIQKKLTVKEKLDDIDTDDI